ncbi:MAG: ABC transporter permease subunit [Cellulomonadaceae bacterium]|jgi:cellobiose transport system permease protein|nr:ABC transporter permease subunit [Cellulomonadaceae bacterium]
MTTQTSDAAVAATPAGWYDDGGGRQRYWDGAAWTEFYADQYEGYDPAQNAAQAWAANKAAHPITTHGVPRVVKAIAGALIGALVGGLIGYVGGGLIAGVLGNSELGQMLGLALLAIVGAVVGWLIGRGGHWDFELSPYLYIAPFFVLFAVTGLFPLIYTAYVATRQWNTLTGDGGVAICGALCDNGNAASIFGNFQWVLLQHDFWIALRNSFSIFLLSTIPQMILALLVAYILDQNLRAKTFWRMGVLLPYVIAPSAAAIIFSQVFSNNLGLINTVLRGLGLGTVAWTSSTIWSHIAIATIVNFRWTGYNALIFLAAMQAIPRELYEASVVDGASSVRQFFSVTIPMLRPTLIFVILTSTIGGLQIFDEVQMFGGTGGAMGVGGTSNQYLTVSLYLWDLGFNRTTIGQPNLGRSAAVAWLLFIIVVLLALLNFWITRKIAGNDAPKAKRIKRKVKEVVA